MTRADSGRDEPRQPRSPPESRADLLDAVADLAHDAVEFGDVPAPEAATALLDAAKEVESDDDAHVYSPDAVYIWDHETEGVVRDDFDDLDEARAFADERVGYEAVDGRPLTEGAQEGDQ